MRYVFRADASKLIGAGHVMRISAIAEELIARGENVIFVGQILDLIWVENRILILGFIEVHRDPTNFISDPETDVLILDSYTISKNDAFILRSNWLHIISIVDEETPDYQCDLRIHPGLDSSWTGDSKIPILAGPKYIPLRKSVGEKRLSKVKIDEALNIGVVAGGSDPYGLVSTLAEILHSLDNNFNAFLFTSSKQNLIVDPRISYVEIGDRLEEITKECDLIITTASTSCLEFLAREFSVGVVRVVENQDHNFKVLGQMGVAAQIGKREEGDVWNINTDLIKDLISSAKLRESLVSRSRQLIDFKGSERIIEAIKSLQ